MDNKRMFAGAIDVAICAYVQSFLLFAYIFIAHSVVAFSFFQKYFLLVLVSIASLLYLLVRDTLPGYSIGKRFAGLMIIDADTGIKASRGQCFLRNITMLIGPVECFYLLLGRSQRLGDILAKTKIVNKS